MSDDHSAGKPPRRVPKVRTEAKRASGVKQAAPTPATTHSPRQCIHCAEPLSPKARFCTKCELFQRPYFRAKSAVGYYTAANAVLATVVIGVSFIFERLPESDATANSDPRIASITCFLDRAFMSVTNRGRRIAAIVDGTVEASALPNLAYDVPPGQEYVKELRTIRVDPKQMVVPQQSAAVLEVEFVDPRTDRIAQFDKAGDTKCEYRFAIKYQDFKSGELQLLPGATETCPCARIRYSQKSGDREQFSDKALGNSN